MDRVEIFVGEDRVEIVENMDLEIILWIEKVLAFYAGKYRKFLCSQENGS